MSLVYFTVFDATTGTVKRAGQCQDYDLAAQAKAADNEVVMEIPQAAVYLAEVDLTPIKAAASSAIDDGAEAHRAKFVTSGAGQAMTYNEKLAEAKAWAADHAASTPILSAEATATGSTVATLAPTVLATAQAWLIVAAKIEAARMSAKKAISNATNVAQIHAATTINWDAVTA